MTKRIFISSVPREFARERRAIREFVHGDALLRQHFEVFLSEDLPAAQRRPDLLYLDEVDRCDLYVALLGAEYGVEDAKGVAPTDLEFRRATKADKPRLIFINGANDATRHPKMRAFLARVGAQVVRRHFSSPAELIGALYDALVQYLGQLALLSQGPFEATPCPKATLADLSQKHISSFLALARSGRGFPLPETATVEEVLIHLNLLADRRPTHAAVLLFGKKPQKFLPNSEVKCVQLSGTEIPKTLPSGQVFKGTVFELVDQAVDFLMPRLSLTAATRATGVKAPASYEFPLEVVREAVVNAVAHRDYSIPGSVRIMLLANRLEIWNPGTLPLALTLEMLARPHGSVQPNPLLAEPLYLAQYSERVGTGIRDMIERCRKVQLPDPQFELTDGFVVRLPRRPASPLAKVSTKAPQKLPPGSPQVRPVLALAAEGAATLESLQEAAGVRDRRNFRGAHLEPLLKAGLLERTIPDKPLSNRQRYRITSAGRAHLATLK